MDNEVLRSRLGEPNSAPLDIGRLKVNAAKFAAEIDDMLGDIHTGLAKFQVLFRPKILRSRYFFLF